MKRMSYKRRVLQDMISIFKELNAIPHEKRKEWGSFGTWKDYDFCLEIINQEMRRMDRSLEAQKKAQDREHDAQEDLPKHIEDQRELELGSDRRGEPVD